MSDRLLANVTIDGFKDGFEKGFKRGRVEAYKECLKMRRMASFKEYEKWLEGQIKEESDE